MQQYLLENTVNCKNANTIFDKQHAAVTWLLSKRHVAPIHIVYSVFPSIGKYKFIIILTNEPSMEF